MAIRDLDLLAGEPITVKLAGTEYQLPADCPIPVVLRTEALGERIRDDSDTDDAGEKRGEALRDLYGALLALFQVHQPKLTEIPLSTSQMLTFVPFVYGGAGDQEEPDEAPPTGTPKSGTQAKAKAKRRTSSRASRS